MLVGVVGTFPTYGTAPAECLDPVGRLAPNGEEGIQRLAPTGSGSHPPGAAEELLEGEGLGGSGPHEPLDERPGQVVFCKHGGSVRVGCDKPVEP